MEDLHIIELYWQRNKSAIKESQTKYGGYCSTIANNILHSAEDESRSYFVYDNSDDPVKSILNYNLSFTTFAPNDNGELMCICLNNPLCASEYLGDYPIITENEATEALMNGKYLSSVPNDYIRNGSIVKENIAKTELVYRNNREKYYQPYYKYYVELLCCIYA